MIHALDQDPRVGRCGEEVAFEAIEVFDRQRHAGAFGDFRSLVQDVGSAFFLVLRGAASRKYAQGRMERTGHDLAFQSRRPLEEALEALDRGLAQVRLRTDRIGLRRHETDRGAAQAEVIELLAKPLVVIHVAFEDRNLDAVESCLL